LIEDKSGCRTEEAVIDRTNRLGPLQPTPKIEDEDEFEDEDD